METKWRSNHKLSPLSSPSGKFGHSEGGRLSTMWRHGTSTGFPLQLSRSASRKMTSVIRVVIRVSEGVTKQIIVHGKGRKVKKGDFVSIHCEGSVEGTNEPFWRYETAADWINIATLNVTASAAPRLS